MPSLQGRRIYVGANIFTYFVDATPGLVEPVTDLLNAAREGVFVAVTGHAVVAGVMVGPYRTRDSMIIGSVREFFHQPKLWEIIEHSGQTWDDAAMLRATLDSPLIDALHMATAASVGCQPVVTNDARMMSALGGAVFPLDVQT